MLVINKSIIFYLVASVTNEKSPMKKLSRLNKERNGHGLSIVSKQKLSKLVLNKYVCIDFDVRAPQQ